MRTSTLLLTFGFIVLICVIFMPIIINFLQENMVVPEDPDGEKEANIYQEVNIYDFILGLDPLITMIPFVVISAIMIYAIQGVLRWGEPDLITYDGEEIYIPPEEPSCSYCGFSESDIEGLGIFTEFPQERYEPQFKNGGWRKRKIRLCAYCGAELEEEN